MESDIKKQSEINYLNFFRERFPDFPKGKLVAGESPDFMVRSAGGNHTGIEITSLYRNHSNLLHDKPEQAIYARLLEKTRELTERFVSEPLTVKMLIGPYPRISDAHILSLAARTSVAIRENLPTANQPVEVTGSRRLSPPVRGVVVECNGWKTVSDWEVLLPLGMDHDIIHDLVAVIDKKEEKLPLYYSSGISECWLLILCDHLMTERNINIYNKLSLHPFRSAFQKVFLLEIMKAGYIELV